LNCTQTRKSLSMVDIHHFLSMQGKPLNERNYIYILKSRKVTWIKMIGLSK